MGFIPSKAILVYSVTRFTGYTIPGMSVDIHDQHGLGIVADCYISVMPFIFIHCCSPLCCILCCSGADQFIHILQCYSTDVGAVTRLLQCQSSDIGYRRKSITRMIITDDITKTLYKEQQHRGHISRSMGSVSIHGCKIHFSVNAVTAWKEEQCQCPSIANPKVRLWCKLLSTKFLS